MPKNSVRFINAFTIMILLVSVINIGCSSKVLEQPERNVLEPPQIAKTTPAETGASIFTVIELEDLEHPILEGLLYVVSANGFFSIRSLITVKEYFQGDDAQFISVTPLQANRPISLAVGKNFAYVLATPKD